MHNGLIIELSRPACSPSMYL